MKKYSQQENPATSRPDGGRSVPGTEDGREASVGEKCAAEATAGQASRSSVARRGMTPKRVAGAVLPGGKKSRQQAAAVASAAGGKAGLGNSRWLVESYVPLVRFLGVFLGHGCEVVLHDMSSKEASVLAIANNHITGRREGAPLTDLALRFVASREYEQRDWVMGYSSRSRDGRPLHSATYFIRDEAGGLAGMLCLNMDISDLMQAREALTRMAQALCPDQAGCGAGEEAGAFRPEPGADPCHSETFSESLEDLTEQLITQVITASDVPAKRMTPAEKMDIVRTLHARGVFLLKGTVGLVAGLLSSSEATIYRYLQKISE